jgi:cytoskeletal protein CcmA (bactofilin family)
VPLVVLAAAACNGPVYEQYDPQVADLLARIEALEAQVGEDRVAELTVEEHIEAIEKLLGIGLGDGDIELPRRLIVPGIIVKGPAEVNENLVVGGEVSAASADVTGKVEAGSAEVSGQVTAGSATVAGKADVGSLDVQEDAWVKGTLTTQSLEVVGDILVAGTLTSAKATIADLTVTARGLVQAPASWTVEGATAVASLAVNSTATFNNGLTVTAGKTTVRDLDVLGVLTYSGLLKLTSLEVVTLDVGLGGIDSTGSIATAADLKAAGDISTDGDVQADGDVSGFNIRAFAALRGDNLSVDKTASIAGKATLLNDLDVRGVSTVNNVTAKDVTMEDLTADTVTADDGVFDVSVELDGQDLADLLDARPTIIRDGDAAVLLKVGPSRTGGATRQEFTTLTAALTWLEDQVIAADARVVIQLDNATYAFSAPLDIAHPDGDRIDIVGNRSAPSSVVLEFSGSQGVIVQDGRRLGTLAGVTVRGKSSPGSGIDVRSDAWLGLEDAVIETFGDVALLVQEGASVTGDNVIARNSRRGVEASYRALVDLDNLDVTGNTREGLMAAMGSVVNAQGVFADNNKGGTSVLADYGSFINASFGTATNGGGGFRADNGSALVAVSSTATDQTDAGYQAAGHSYIIADNAIARRSTTGFSGVTHSYVRAINVTSSSNTGYGFASRWAGVIYASGRTASGNSLGETLNGEASSNGLGSYYFTF